MRCACEVASANAGAAAHACNRRQHAALAAARAARCETGDFMLLAIFMAVIHSRELPDGRWDYTCALERLWLSQLPRVATCRQPHANRLTSMLCAVICESDHSMSGLN